MFLQHGIVLSHEAVRDWERKLAPLLGETLRKRRYGAVGASWYVDETYVRVNGRWQSLYRAIDRDGTLVDVRLSETRDLAPAETFFRPAWTGTTVRLYCSCTASGQMETTLTHAPYAMSSGIQ